MFQTEHLQEKWQPVLEHPDLGKIEDSYKRAVTTLILENQEKAMREDRKFSFRSCTNKQHWWSDFKLGPNFDFTRSPCNA